MQVAVPGTTNGAESMPGLRRVDGSPEALPQAISGPGALNGSKGMRLNNLPEIQFDKYPAIFL
jgi:hypothetical protein